MKRYFYLMIAAFLGLCFASCEGPAGPPGLDGTDGVDGANGEVACLTCHGTATKDAIGLQFQQSEHSVGAIAVDYAGGRASCAECHSSEGFIEFATTGDVAEDIAAPGAWECKTCHSIHQTFEADDFALRLSDPVTLANSTELDYGHSNLCMNCHKARTNPPTDMGGQYIDLNGVEDDGPGGVGDDKEYLVPAGSFYISSTHYGPHHGPHANTLAGTGYAEIAGTYSYGTVSSHPHAGENGRCVGCHMATYEDGSGGHTFNPSLNGCNATSCHSSITDFDHNNVQTETEALLEELRDLLVAQGVVAKAENDTSYVWNPELDQHDTIVVKGEGYHPIKGVYTLVQSQAFFNWVGIEEDRSLGVHNPAYVKALLENSIQAIE